MNAELEWEEFINLHQLSLNIEGKRHTLMLLSNAVAQDEITKHQIEILIQEYIARTYNADVIVESN